MKKKTAIFFVIILFLVSTTGLPVFSHYCLMLGESVNSGCNDCVDDQLIASACCVEDIDLIEMKIETGKTECCVDKFDYKRIEDHYCQSNNNINLSNQIIVNEFKMNSDDSDSEKKYSQKSYFYLPPPKFGKELLTKIHQLKIDLPIC